MEPKVLRVTEVSRLIGVSKATLYRWIKAGGFPRPLQLGPRAVRWPKDEIDEWLRNRPKTDKRGQ